MITTYFFDPFKDIFEGGSASEPFSNPPIIWTPSGRACRVLFVWDLPTIRAKQSAESYARLTAEGVTRQGMVRASDGAEYRVNLRGGSADFILSSFRGTPFTPPPKSPKEKDMTHLARLKKNIAELYADEPAAEAAVKEGLAKADTLGKVKTYLSQSWDTATFNACLEEFFASEEGA